MGQNTYSRRAFLKKLWLALGVLTIAELTALLVAFFRPRKPRDSSAGPDPVVIAGKVDRFDPGTVNAFVQGKFYLARLENGGFLALSRRCTHLGCTVPWVASEKHFICPCHSSRFDIRGDVIDAPAPRALDLHPVSIENNLIRVDTSKLYKRSVFAADQVTYTDST